MSNHTISKGKLKEWINGSVVAIIDHNGQITNEEHLWDQLDEGWCIGVVTEPISNAIVYTWVVCTANHRDHRGLDAGECVELVSEYEQNPDFIDNWANAGGMVWEVENN